MFHEDSSVFSHIEVSPLLLLLLLSILAMVKGVASWFKIKCADGRIYFVVPCLQTGDVEMHIKNRLLQYVVKENRHRVYQLLTVDLIHAVW
jgi:hypothetical protein